jgi:hypothetical protein
MQADGCGDMTANENQQAVAGCVTAFVIVAALALYLVLPSSSPPSNQESPPLPTPKLTEADKAEIAARERDAVTRSANLRKATRKQIEGIIDACKNAVSRQIDKDYKGPYSAYLVDEYTGDEDQAAAYLSGGSVRSTKQRSQEFFARSKDSTLNPELLLNLTFTGMVIGEDFSGSVRHPTNYTCQLKPDLSIDTVESVGTR